MIIKEKKLYIFEIKNNFRIKILRTKTNIESTENFYFNLLHNNCYLVI